MKKIIRFILVVVFFVTVLNITFLLNNTIHINFLENKKLQDNNVSEKTITGLGITPIINPIYGNGGWNKVWFGSGSAPLRFNVLNIHETNMSQGKVGMLLDCDSIVRGADKAMNNFWLYEWYKSDLARSVKWILDDRFDEPERSAGLLLKPNKPNKSDTDAPDIFSSGNKKYRYTNPTNNYSNAFILDAYEIMNPTYGFPTTEGPSVLRKKTGATEYWLRSENGNNSQSDYLAYVSDKTGLGLKSDGWDQDSRAGVSPAINLNTDKVLFSTLVSGEVGKPDAEYKLTVIDDYVECNGSYGCRDLYSFKIAIPSGQQVTRSGRTLTIPFSITGGINKNSISQISILITNKPWNSEGAQVLSYGKLDNIEGDIHTGGTGTYTVPNDIGLYDENVGGAYVYLFAESLREGNKPDHASNLIKLNFIKDIRIDVEGYNGYYDGEEHGLIITTYSEGTDIKYGLAEDDVTLDESPKFKNADTNIRVYYEVTLDGRITIRDSKLIVINKRPIKVSGIIVNQKEYDGNTSATLNIDNVLYDGLITGDDIKLTNYTGNFVDKNQNPFQKVNLTYEITGEDISNYYLDLQNSQKTTRANIYLRHIKVSGIKVYPKVWDGTTTARLDYSDVVIDRIIDGDDLYITATGTFDNVATGFDKEVTISDIILHGIDKDNYYLEEGEQQTSALGNISSYGTLPIVHIPSDNDLTFTYDGTEHVVELTAESTVENADPAKVSIDYSEVESITSPLWSSSPRSLTDIGALRVYYRVTDQNQGIAMSTGSFVIRVTPAPLKVDNYSVTVANKVYDGTTNATFDLGSATFDNILPSDSNYIELKTGVAEFSDKNAGTDKEVYLSELSIGNKNLGDKSKNYKLTSSALTKGTITKRPLTISGAKVLNKLFDNSTDANINIDSLVISNLIDGDDVSVNVTGTFDDSNIGDNKNVTLTYELSGSDASNYYVDELNSEMSENASIYKKELSVTKNNVEVEYDGDVYSPSLNINDSVDVTIKYGLSEDNVTLDESPVFSEIGITKVYYKVFPQNTNYEETNGELDVVIKPRGLIISGVKANDKNYDANNSVVLDTSELKVENVLEGDDITVDVFGLFESETPGNDKQVLLYYTISGPNADKYLVNESLSETSINASIRDNDRKNTKTGDNILIYIILFLSSIELLMLSRKLIKEY